MMVWCVELREDNDALVEQGQEVNVEIKSGNTIDALKESIFPNYDYRARAHVIIYSSSASAASSAEKNTRQWKAANPRDLLEENNASVTYGYIDPKQGVCIEDIPVQQQQQDGKLRCCFRIHSCIQFAARARKYFHSCLCCFQKDITVPNSLLPVAR
jgi:hypothetical protein